MEPTILVVIVIIENRDWIFYPFATNTINEFPAPKSDIDATISAILIK